MWTAIVGGIIIYSLFSYFSDDDDNILNFDNSHFHVLFSVADRLEKLYGGKAYVGLRIPDADTGTRQNIDMVLITKGEALVISVKNVSGFLSTNADGSWVCEGNYKRERLPDPVAEAKKQASIFESYLEQRGVALPEGFLSCKVVLPNPKCCNHSLRWCTSSSISSIQPSYFPPEVITAVQWSQPNPEPKRMDSNWLKGAHQGVKKLNLVLSTAPMWDRLEIEGNKYVLGEFLEFKGEQEDTQALRNVKRSKVSRLVVGKTSMFGLDLSRLLVLYSPRDYRSEGASASEWTEVHVSSSTEVLFQPENSTKVRKCKLSSVVSLSLSA